VLSSALAVTRKQELQAFLLLTLEGAKRSTFALESLTPGNEAKDKVYNQLHCHNVDQAAVVKIRIGVLARNRTLLIH
jgi:hypothetical protein